MKKAMLFLAILFFSFGSFGPVLAEEASESEVVSWEIVDVEEVPVSLRGIFGCEFLIFVGIMHENAEPDILVGFASKKGAQDLAEDFGAKSISELKGQKAYVGQDFIGKESGIINREVERSRRMKLAERENRAI